MQRKLKLIDLLILSLALSVCATAHSTLQINCKISALLVTDNPFPSHVYHDTKTGQDTILKYPTYAFVSDQPERCSQD